MADKSSNHRFCRDTAVGRIRSAEDLIDEKENCFASLSRFKGLTQSVNFSQKLRFSVPTMNRRPTSMPKPRDGLTEEISHAPAPGKGEHRIQPDRAQECTFAGHVGATQDIEVHALVQLDIVPNAGKPRQQRIPEILCFEFAPSLVNSGNVFVGFS